jgi:hypothetical protein
MGYGGAQSSFRGVDAYRNLAMSNYVSLEQLKTTLPTKRPQNLSAHLAFQL